MGVGVGAGLYQSGQKPKFAPPTKKNYIIRPLSLCYKKCDKKKILLGLGARPNPNLFFVSILVEQRCSSAMTGTSNHLPRGTCLLTKTNPTDASGLHKGTFSSNIHYKYHFHILDYESFPRAPAIQKGLDKLS